MGLMEEIEKDKKALAAMADGDKATPVKEEPVEEADDVTEPEPEDDEGAEDETPNDGESDGLQKRQETNAAEEEVDPNATPDKRAFVKMRREVAALKKQLAEKNAAPQPTAQPTVAKEEPVTDADPEPIRETEYTSWLEWKLRQSDNQVSEIRKWKDEQTQQTQQQQQITQAVDEFRSIQNNFSKTVADYDDRAGFVETEIRKSMARVAPNLKGPDLERAVAMHVLRMAGTYVQQGLDPAEELYHMAEEWGYEPKAEGEQAEIAQQRPERKTPDLRVIAQNKARSGGMAAAKGRGSAGRITKEAALNMTNQEYADLARTNPNVLRELNEG